MSILLLIVQGLLLATVSNGEVGWWGGEGGRGGGDHVLEREGDHVSGGLRGCDSSTLDDPRTVADNSSRRYCWE